MAYLSRVVLGRVAAPPEERRVVEDDVGRLHVIVRVHNLVVVQSPPVPDVKPLI
jgi:hypothetical protein